ncbi:MaoC family dehydratase [Piscinibacter koreensis]|uniref:MaoC family dehydratase n=1 Tax=Piscinibacter koreensis TaxID=2742824 RepID=A0A7Y6NMW0_9BURK|nr:MaoC family dehydratase [Schlegelella koreensis]NUZ06087.1 MaoC family dehydratase [Schlegelella koreensis]
MLEVDDLSQLADHVGSDLGCSAWLTVDQPMIDAFAELTGDRNWYHVDVERARRELPEGRTIAHGLLTLSLVPGLASQIVRVRRHGHAFNYGFDKVRYPTPVQVGARVRLHMHLAAAEPAPKGTLLRRRYTMELEGAAKPAMVADMLTLVVRREAST